jgi:hypothetical protein
MRARPGAVVASESPSLAGHYAERAKRSDLVCVSLSDPEAVKKMQVGDFIIVARGRRYFSNDALTSSLAHNAKPDLQLFLGEVPSVNVYILTDETLKLIGKQSHPQVFTDFTD